MKQLIFFVIFLAFSMEASADPKPATPKQKVQEALQDKTNVPPELENEYPIGIDDVLEISVIQPDQMTHIVRVSPDGFISFPYIGSVSVQGLTLSEIQEKIKDRLAAGFLKYPVVYVSLVESRSRKFFVYGEVETPGAFPLEENTTILRALSMAGGFTRFGSSSGVKVLSPRAGNKGYELKKVNVNKILAGNPEADIIIKPGDILVVAGGMF